MSRLYKTKKIHPAKVTMDIDCSKLLIKSYVIGNKRHVHDESREHPAIDDILKSFNIEFFLKSKYMVLVLKSSPILFDVKETGMILS